MLWGLLVAVAGLVVVGVASGIAHRKAGRAAAATGDDPRLTPMIDTSKVLVGGLTIVTAALTLVAARAGGTARVLANSPNRFYLGVAFATVSIMLAIASMIVVASAPSSGVTGFWLVVVTLSLAAFVTATFTFVSASRDAAGRFERATISASLTTSQITFEASLPLLKANETLTVTVHAYPPGVEHIPIPAGESGEMRGSELFSSTTGPAADGLATIKGAVPIPVGAYEQVEVRAYSNDDDYDCRSEEASQAPRDAASCVQLWLVPRAPTVTG